MTATRYLAGRLADALGPRGRAVPVEIWMAFLMAAVRLLLECFADSELAARYLRQSRFARWRMHVRLAWCARDAGVPYDLWDRACAWVIDESTSATSGLITALWADELEAALPETAEYPALGV